MQSYALEEFKQLLIAEKSDYRQVGEQQSQVKQFQFIGAFQGREVIWHAHLETLQEFRRRNHLELNSQQMDIEAIDHDNYRIQIILKLPQLNTASIMMSIKMVRQYKRLSLGRHNWN